MRAPKRLYWVELDTIGKLGFRQKGGGKFTNLSAAEDRKRQLLCDGIKSTIYETQELDWRPAGEEPEHEGWDRPHFDATGCDGSLHTIGACLAEVAE